MESKQFHHTSFTKQMNTGSAIYLLVSPSPFRWVEVGECILCCTCRCRYSSKHSVRSAVAATLHRKRAGLGGRAPSCLYSCETENKKITYISLEERECFSNAESKEGNVLFNDALNTFYLRLYGIRHIVKDDPSHHERIFLPRSYISLLAERKEGNVFI